MIKQVQYLEFFDSLLNGDKEACKRICLTLLENGESPKSIYLDLFQKSLYRIGKLWEDGKINIADEHVATTIIDHLITMISDKVRKEEDVDNSVIVTCVDKEFHQIGAKMVANFFEINGWQTFYLGANTPARELVRYIEEKQPDYVGLSINFHLNGLRLLETIDNIRKKFPEQKIIIGGQGITGIRAEIDKNYPDVVVCESLEQLEEFISKSR
ncbi:MAG: cobalamin B12-binding domain-containing protein [Ignavibacteriaceae bacterium]|nr:cobalamin B12-binding domain-containing protein [Ignavibacteriaceae bacterium]